MINGAPSQMPGAYSEPNQKSKTKISARTAIGLKPLTVFTSTSIPDGWARLGWALNIPPDAIKYEFFLSNQMSFTCLQFAQRRSSNAQNFV